jgi:hypothetical protein
VLLRGTTEDGGNHLGRNSYRAVGRSRTSGIGLSSTKSEGLTTSTHAIRLPRRLARPTGWSRTKIAAGAIVLLGIGLAIAFASGALESERKTSGSQVCENAFCLNLPADWTGETAYGGGSNQIIAAPFPLPPVHQGGDIVSIPRARFIIIVSVGRRGYLFGWPRRQTLAISADQLKPQQQVIIPSSPRSAAYARATLGDRSFEVWVDFRDPHPSESQLATVNSVLATLHPAPPPRVTN